MKPFQTLRYFAKFVIGGNDMNVRLVIWFLVWQSLFSATLQLGLPRAFAADTDDDGLLDLIDVPGFDPNGAGTLDLQRRGIQDLDGVSLLTNATQLYLSDNQITSIESGDFAGLDNLQFLTLSDNQITSVEGGDFAGLDNLQALSLNDNRITSIESGDFAGLDNLQRLDMWGNQITSLESGDFAGLDNLQDLLLQRNRITSLERGDFDGLGNLQGRLWLSDNRITSIESGDFDGLGNLQSLDLWGNQLTSIESGDFAGLDNLQYLSLGNIGITSIERGDFDGLDNLRILILSVNRITSIESGDFDGLGNLQSLALDRNQIVSIESGDFLGLENLKEIHLDDNQITSIESGAFQGLNSLTTLDLSKNSITQLNLSNATFDSLQSCDHHWGPLGLCIDRGKITNVILDHAVLSLGSFEAILGETRFITSASLVGLTFSDTNPVDMSRLLDIPTLDNVTVDKALFERYAAEFNAFDAQPGNTVTVVPEPSAIGLLAIGLLALVNTKRNRRTP